MKTMYPDAWPEFYTATISQWRPLLQSDKYKDVIVKSLQYLVNDKQIRLNGFVIMSTHIHLIWQACHGHMLKKVQQNFMKFTAHNIKCDLLKTDSSLLKEYKVNSADRDYRFWKRRSLAIELFSPSVFHQKLNYIHYNPVRAGLCAYPEAYYYSSAKFYHTGVDDFQMLTG
jgi:REP element-mobilizing transposase RayT